MTLPLTAARTFGLTSAGRITTLTGWCARDTTDGEMYVLECDKTTGRLPLDAYQAGSWAISALNTVDMLDGTIIAATGLSTSAWTTAIAVTAAAAKGFQLFDTGGQYLLWATGAAGLEVALFVTGPGTDQTMQVQIASGLRLSVKALNTVPTGGSIAANLLG